MEDQPADSGDLTAGSADATAGDADPTGGRRGGFLRRALRRRTPSPFPVDLETPGTATEMAPIEDAKPAPQKPVGKAGRAAKAVAAAEAEEAETPAVAPVVSEPVAPEPGSGPNGAEVLDIDAAPEDEPVTTDEHEPDTTDEDEPVTTDEHEAVEAAPVLVEHQPAGRRLLIAAVAAAGLFVAGSAFAGAMAQPYLADRAVVDTKVEVAQTAVDAITTLWSYTPADMDTLADRASKFLGGDFATEYRRYIDAIVETNKQAQVTNTTEVMGAAVETLGPTEATAIVYTNSVSTSPVSKNVPSLRYLSYRLTLERDDAQWLITRMNAITQLDLTPQL